MDIEELSKLIKEACAHHKLLLRKTHNQATTFGRDASTVLAEYLINKGVIK